MSKTNLSIKKIFFLIISLVLHLLAIGLIIYLVHPIARWYLEIKPARGVDLYLSASYVSHLLKHFALRFNGWKEIWYSGVPYSKDYPSLYFYLMVPLAKHFGLIPGIQRFAVIGLFVYAAFSYLLYHQLSKNRILAIVLTLATLFSANLYRSLVWAGGIPFWTTQAFFPIVLFLVVKYCQSQNDKWLFLAGMAAGLGIMGHPQNFLNLILPAAVLLLFFWQPAFAEASAGRPAEKKFSFKKRIFDVVKFGGITYLVGTPVIVELAVPVAIFAGLLKAIFGLLGMAAPVATEGPAASLETTAQAIEEWTRSQFNLVFLDSHPLLWHLSGAALAIFIFSLLLRKKRFKAMISFFPFAALAALVVGSVYLYSRGIDLYITGWYKAFWPVLSGLATWTAFLWGEAKQIFVEREFWQKKAIKVCRWVGVGVVNLSLIGIGWQILLPAQIKTIERLEKIDQFSSAFPEVLNVKTSEEDLLRLKEQFKPKLMVDDPKDFRLYIIDATVNIWWGGLEDVPLTRGYVDPPLTTPERWGIFWLDSALGPTNAGPKSSLIEDWQTPEAVADNNLRFLLDWYATKYLEGNHLSAASANFASNIITDALIEAEEEIESQGGVVYRYKPEEHWSDENLQSLKFYRVKSDLVSPILMASNATSILHVGDAEGYDTLTRFLGEVNLGPRKVVLARGPKEIDKLSFSDLTNFDAIILYKYDYGNYDKTWGLIGKYIEKGGKVFIDTGPEVKESDTTRLPERFPSELPGVFPFKRTVRENIGKYWDPEAADLPLNEGVDFSKFSPLIFEEDVWNVSHPLSDEDIREDSQVILRQKGIPVVMEKTMGKGKVIWAGYNLPYHAIRDYNPEEAKFFTNLLSELVSLKEEPVLAKGSFISSRERVIEVNGGKGVIFKEQFFDGWKAFLGGKKLKIYEVGPSSPGFMYVRLPEGVSGQLRFIYAGSFEAKVYFAVSALAILFIFDYLFGGRFLIALIRRISAPIKKKLGKWWEKEDEY